MAKSTRIVAITRFWPADPINGSFQYTSMLLSDIARCAELTIMGVPHSSKADKSSVEIRANRTIARVLAWCSSLLPVAATSFSSRSNRDALDNLLRESDPSHVIIDHIASVWALRVLESPEHAHRKVIFCAHNAEANVRASAVGLYGLAHPIRAIANLLDQRRCARVEARLARRCAGIICISEADAAYFGALHSACVKVIRPHVDPISASDFHPLERSDRQIVVIGSFNWDLKRTNLEQFLDIAYERLVANDINIKVVGWLQEPYLGQYRRRWPLINFTGFVDRVEPEVKSARAGLLIDEAGGGFKLKTLDYVRLGLPMFGLISAVDHQLAAQSPSCVQVTRTADELTSLIIDQIDRLADLERMRSNAVGYVNNVYVRRESNSWRSLIPEMRARA